MTPIKQIEKASEAFTEAYLSGSQDFLACEKHHRKRLLTMDLYKVEDVYEKAMKAGYNLALERMEKILEDIDFEQRYLDSENLFDKELFIEELKQAMKL